MRQQNAFRERLIFANIARTQVELYLTVRLIRFFLL